MPQYIGLNFFREFVFIPSIVWELKCHVFRIGQLGPHNRDMFRTALLGQWCGVSQYIVLSQNSWVVPPKFWFCSPNYFTIFVQNSRTEQCVINGEYYAKLLNQFNNDLNEKMTAFGQEVRLIGRKNSSLHSA